MNTHADDFKIGEMYYRLTYADRGLCYPKVETFIFVGKNLSHEDIQETWYFEFADSHARSKSETAPANHIPRVSIATHGDLEDMLDLRGLIRELEQAGKRRLGNQSS